MSTTECGTQDDCDANPGSPRNARQYRKHQHNGTQP